MVQESPASDFSFAYRTGGKFEKQDIVEPGHYFPEVELKQVAQNSEVFDTP